jgi:hypothetical protein
MELAELIRLMPSHLALAANEGRGGRRIVIFIDALNQLDTDDDAHQVSRLQVQ